MTLRRLFLVPVFACFACLAHATPTDPVVSANLAQARDFEQRQQLTSAVDSARKALKLSHGDCDSCYETLYRVQLKMEVWKDAAATASAWSSHAADAAIRSHAEMLEASALLEQYQAKPAQNLLSKSDDVMQHAIADAPADAALHLLRGHILALLKQDAQARAEFAQCSTSPACSPVNQRRAINFAANLEAAREPLAPTFEMKRPDGPDITLDSLAGKVVLIDFWATWCGPCNSDRDYIQSIASEFKHDDFVLLGVDGDRDEDLWMKYRSKYHLQGMQVRDSRDGLHDVFHVTEIPTYIILDGNGMIRARITGTVGDIRGKVRSLLADARAQQGSAGNTDTKR